MGESDIVAAAVHTHVSGSKQFWLLRAITAGAFASCLSGATGTLLAERFVASADELVAA
jgi:hypothetical protein